MTILVKQLLAIRASADALIATIDASLDRIEAPEANCPHPEAKRTYAQAAGMGGRRTWTCECGAKGAESLSKEDPQ